jgi:hypothetical protein
MKARKKLLKRVAEIDSRLAKIQKEGAIIKRHCSATDAEIRAEVPKYEKELDDAEAFALGQKFMPSQMRAEFRKRQDPL